MNNVVESELVNINHVNDYIDQDIKSNQRLIDSYKDKDYPKNDIFQQAEDENKVAWLIYINKQLNRLKYNINDIVREEVK